MNDLGAGPSRAEVTLEDGNVLVADVWACPGLGAGPVVFERTPYGRARTDQAEQAAGAATPKDRAEVASLYHEAGCHYVVQDCRGTGDSTGTFEKYTQERADGCASLDWLRAQDFCDGRIAMVGFSYGAACQLSTIFDNENAPLASVLDCGGFSDALTSGIRQGGALLLKQATWALAQAGRDARASGRIAEAKRIKAVDVLAWLRKAPSEPDESPLAAAPEHAANLAAMWTNGCDGPYWNRPGLRTPANALGKTPTQCLLVTSWNDTSLIGTLENYAALSAPEASCPSPALIIGPWTHGDRWSTSAGDAEFGVAALPETAFGASLPRLRRDFVSQALNGEAANIQGVHYFEIGGGSGPGGRWRHGESWPPAASETTIALSNESLTPDAPQTGKRTFSSDPESPVPTLGGAINSGGAIMPGGMMEQASLDGRNDILRYRSTPFESEQCFAGPVSASIWATCDAPDFDIAAKLCLILQDGQAFNITDGLCRARHRNGMTTEQFSDVKTPTLIPVTLNPMALRVMPGQSLRLDISGSNFPCFDINPQTGAPQGQPGPRRTATISVLTGAEYPSSLTLMEHPT